MYFDENGERKRTNVKIVCGAPASGKTTYVQEHMKKGDCVVDLDYIKRAISYSEKTEPIKNLLGTALKIRDFLYSEIEQDNIEAETVWIIAGLPTEQEKKALIERFRAELIFLDVPQDICIERAMNDEERKDKNFQLEIIKNYFLKRFNEY